MRDTNEDLIKKYVMSGGRLYTIDRISIIRDGGTKVIMMLPLSDKVCFYIHKETNELHNGYPLTSENKVTDPPTKEYIKDAMLKYVESCEHELELSKKFLTYFQ